MLTHARFVGCLILLILTIGQADGRSAAGQSVVLSYGWNATGATGLGIDSQNSTLIPTPIIATNLAGKNITQIAAGHGHSLLLADDGSVFAFGENLNGQTGLNTTDGNTLIATPIITTNLAGKKIIQISAGDQNSFLLADDGSVFAFGPNEISGLGSTFGKTLIATPINMANLTGKKITQISGGGYASLLLADDGSVFSFGFDYLGATGRGIDGFTSTIIATSINTSNLAGKKITQISAGFDHSLLLADDGTVFAFGSNENGKTGLGTASGSTLVPTPINTSNLAGKTISQVVAGYYGSMLLADDGTVFSMPASLVATPIDMTNIAGKKITHIDTDGFTSLLAAEDGSVFYFGGEFNAPLIATPINATNLMGKRVTQVAQGYSHGLLLAVPIPEPGSFGLAAIALTPLVLWRRGVRRIGNNGQSAH